MVRLLEEYLASIRARRFNWLDWNCVHFTGEWLAYCQDTTAILDAYTEQTLTARSALRFAQTFGGLEQAYTTLLQRTALPPLAANTGDLVLFAGSPGSSAGALGICNGASAVLLHPHTGTMGAPMRSATRTWKIRPANKCEI